MTTRILTEPQLRLLEELAESGCLIRTGGYHQPYLDHRGWKCHKVHRGTLAALINGGFVDDEEHSSERHDYRLNAEGQKMLDRVHSRKKASFPPVVILPTEKSA